MAATRADKLFGEACSRLGLQDAGPDVLYRNIEHLVAELEKFNRRETIPPATTGAISERLCRQGLESVDELRFRRAASDWKWVADFMVFGEPYDVAVSVKSFTAKERFLVSGTGSLLAPTLGWGLFKDPSEWGESRVRSILYRGFFAVYMPAGTLEAVIRNNPAVQEFRNINQKPFLRDLTRFPEDLQGALDRKTGRVDIRRL